MSKYRTILYAICFIVGTVLFLSGIPNKKHEDKLPKDIEIVHGSIYSNGDIVVSKHGETYPIQDPPELEDGEKVYLIVQTNGTQETTDDYVIYIGEE